MCFTNVLAILPLELEVLGDLHGGLLLARFALIACLAMCFANVLAILPHELEFLGDFLLSCVRGKGCESDCWRWERFASAIRRVNSRPSLFTLLNLPRSQPHGCGATA